jgi:hypothetical protein
MLREIHDQAAKCERQASDRDKGHRVKSCDATLGHAGPPSDDRVGLPGGVCRSANEGEWRGALARQPGVVVGPSSDQRGDGEEVLGPAVRRASRA